MQGHDFPEDLSPYKLVVHCGACMRNRRDMLSRHVPLPAGRGADHQLWPGDRLLLGIFERALEPFPAALEIARNLQAVTP